MISSLSIYCKLPYFQQKRPDCLKNNGQFVIRSIRHYSRKLLQIKASGKDNVAEGTRDDRVK